MEFLHNFVGFSGTIAILTAYLLLQLGRISGENLPYLLLNLIGASCVAFSLCFQFNLSAMAIEVAWIVISLIGLLRMAIRNSDRFHASP